MPGVHGKREGAGVGRSGPDKGVITKGVFSLAESLESLKSLDSLESLEDGRILLRFPESGGSLGLRLPRPATGPPELEFPKTAVETAGETAEETRGAGGTAAGTASRTALSLRSRETEVTAAVPAAVPPTPRVSPAVSPAVSAAVLGNSSLGGPVAGRGSRNSRNSRISKFSRISRKWTFLKTPLFQKNPFSEPEQKGLAKGWRRPNGLASFHAPSNLATSEVPV